MLRQKLKLELTGVFDKKRTALFIIFLLISLVFLYHGVMVKEKSLPMNSGEYSQLHVFFPNHNTPPSHFWPTGDVAGTFYVLGSLFMIYMGFTAFKNERLFLGFDTILFRLAFLNLFFLLLLASVLLSGMATGLSLLTRDRTLLAYFSLYLFLYLNFFFAAGVFIRILTRAKLRVFPLLMLIWVLSVWFVPNIMDSTPLHRQPPAINDSSSITNSLPRDASRWLPQTSLFPTTYYNVLSRNIARHNTLPPGFLAANILTLFYAALLLTASFLLLNHKRTPTSAEAPPNLNLGKGNTYFILCEDSHYRQQLFNRLQSDPRNACLDTIASEELLPDVPASLLLEYYCTLAGSDKQQAKEILHTLGVKEDSFNWKETTTGHPVLDYLLAVYCASILAKDYDTLVVNDLLKNISPQFEHLFLQFVHHLNQSGKTVIYLSNEMFEIALPMSQKIEVTGHKGFRIDPLAVKLR